MAYVRGSQVQFVVLPDMLAKAPFFNRIKLWRKFKGNAVFGGGAFINKAGMLIRPGDRPPVSASGPGQFAPGVREGPPRGMPGPYGAPRPMGGYGPGPGGPGGPRGPPHMGGGYGGPPQQYTGGYGPPQPHQQYPHHRS